jgi:hypothetical protein
LVKPQLRLKTYVRQVIEHFETHFNTYVYSWIGLANATFILLQFVTAPFGRHTSKEWGPMIKNKFSWFLMELPSFIIILISLIIGSQVNSITCIIGTLWLVHYFNRTFVFPFRIKSGDKKMPLFITGSAIFFNLFNAGFNGYYLAELSSYTSDWLTSWQFMIGLPLFAAGFAINFWSDEILMNLRKPGETSYVMDRFCHSGMEFTCGIFCYLDICQPCSKGNCTPQILSPKVFGLPKRTKGGVSVFVLVRLVEFSSDS